MNLETVRRAVAVTPGDLRLDAWHPELRIDNMPEFPVQGPYHGYEGLRQWAEDITEVAHDFRTEVERITEVDDRRVVALLRSRGRAAHTGIEIEVAWGAVYTLREGKVAHAQGYRSTNRLSKPPASRSTRSPP